MSRFERWFEQIKLRRKGNTVSIDMGEIPHHDPSVLVFPENTSIYIGDKDLRTQPGEEFLAKKWWNNGEGMTWGYLSLPADPYFKALGDPIEVRDLTIIKPSEPLKLNRG